MSDEKTQPRLSEKGLSEAERRRRRQAEALRANLSRRKTQVRGRAEEEAADGAESAPSADTAE